MFGYIFRALFLILISIHTLDLLQNRKWDGMMVAMNMSVFCTLMIFYPEATKVSLWLKGCWVGWAILMELYNLDVNDQLEGKSWDDVLWVSLWTGAVNIVTCYGTLWLVTL